MPTENTDTAGQASAATAPAGAASHTVDVVAERSATLNSERERTRTILEAGKKYDASDLASEFVRDGKGVDEFRAALLERVNTRNSSVKASNNGIGLNESEKKRYSFLRAINALANPTDKAAQDAARFELECHEAAQRTAGRSAKGLMIPTDVLLSPINERAGVISQGALGTGYTGTGAATVQTTLLGSSFVEMLRNKCLLMQLGTQLSGLVGNVDIPKQVNYTQAQWIGEDDAAPQTSMDFGLISLRPKTVASYAEITRRMLMQPSIDVEALTRMDLAKSLAEAIDNAGYYGDGSANKPVGIKYQDGIRSVAFTTANSPLYTELVDMETACAVANADVSTARYLTNAKGRGYAKKTLEFPGVNGSQKIWMDDEVNGYPALVSNVIATGDWFYGIYYDLLIGLWGGLDMTVDPFTRSLQGRVRLIIMQDVDINIRRPESFCYGS